MRFITYPYHERMWIKHILHTHTIEGRIFQDVLVPQDHENMRDAGFVSLQFYIPLVIHLLNLVYNNIVRKSMA